MNLTNAPQPVTVCGRQFLFTELVDNDHDTLNQWVRGRYLQTVRSSFLPDTPASEKQFELSLAHRTASGMTWMDSVGSKMMLSLDGVAMLMFVSTRRNHPKETFESLREMLYDRAAEAKLNPKAHQEINQGVASVNGLEAGEGDKKADPSVSS
jgi:hypothetical protein